MTERQLDAFVKRLTLDEKASLMSGRDFWRTKPLCDKGVWPLRMSDGPHGLRKEDLKNAKANGGHSVKATCFPTAAALACSWDESLAEEVGTAIAEECLAHGVGVLLGPGVNIKRSPLGGRNFEYFSEDPLVAGKMGAAMIRGIQKKGVGASLKHFAANNQETLRMTISAEVDERALREIYLKPFEIAVKEGHPATIMCSYNRINGVYASQNKKLLTDILRQEWGFDGLVMSDWGAVDDRVAGVKAGLDLEMPYSGGTTDQDVAQAVREGRLSEQALDEAVKNVLRLVAKYARKPRVDYSQPAHRSLAEKACEQSAVLLKNDGILPLEEKSNLAVIGALASGTGRYQGGGSSVVNAHGPTGFTSAMEARGWAYVNYAPGYHTNHTRPDPDLEEQAVQFARTAQTVVYFMGLTDLYESEGFDRTHMKLPGNQVSLLEKLAQANPNLVVVLAGGSPVEMPWLDKVRAVLYTALGGERLGMATYRLLFGEVCPSGKLAETWPMRLEENPSARYFPMGPRVVTYNESIYVGYRYYDKAGQKVRFPFGFGLSYTRFAYQDLNVEQKENGDLCVKVHLANVGERAGDEIVQVYAGCPHSVVHRPVHVLVGFARVHLEKGEEKLVEICVPYDALSFYDTTQHRFVVEAGQYEICVGACSRDLPLRKTLLISGQAVMPSYAQSAEGPYGTFSDNRFSDAAFYAVHSRTPQNNSVPKLGEFDRNTPLRQMQDSHLARALATVARVMTRKTLHFSPYAQVNEKVSHAMVGDLPFRNVQRNAWFLISESKAKILLDACNRKKDKKNK
ncbi:glycoside hydrolase family 3 N-terminal domain-containing protein [uncultured Ruthenibacterium sp.]|uniref:glycoside hydrolase family 3 N-terminal domain-containing protein n=1 Tax=uncultured Ruthenibacterium sp. TaxID=1905347 RepID=UPI00349EC8F8